MVIRRGNDSLACEVLWFLCFVLCPLCPLSFLFRDIFSASGEWLWYMPVGLCSISTCASVPHKIWSMVFIERVAIYLIDLDLSVILMYP